MMDAEFDRLCWQNVWRLVMTGREAVDAYVNKFGGFPFELDVADEEVDTPDVRMLMKCVRTGKEYTYVPDPDCDY